MKKRMLSVMFAAVLVFGFTAEVKALNLNPFKRAGRVKASTMIVTGNYVKSRLLAELAQYYSKQPVLLVSPDVDGSDQLFYMPAINKAQPVGMDEYLELIKYCNPKRIVILGGDDYVPRKFVDLARQDYSVISLDSDNWSKNAQALGDILKLHNLQSQFDEYMGNVDKINK